jgi:hypothetical protein
MIVNKQDLRKWIELVWLEMKAVITSCEYENEYSTFIKYMAFLD